MINIVEYANLMRKSNIRYYRSPTFDRQISHLTFRGHTKECAQCDQCAQPLSAGGCQRAPCVHSRMKGTQHTRTHAARRTPGSSRQCDQPALLLTYTVRAAG